MGGRGGGLGSLQFPPGTRPRAPLPALSTRTKRWCGGRSARSVLASPRRFSFFFFSFVREVRLKGRGGVRASPGGRRRRHASPAAPRRPPHQPLLTPAPSRCLRGARAARRQPRASSRERPAWLPGEGLGGRVHRRKRGGSRGPSRRDSRSHGRVAPRGPAANWRSDWSRKLWQAVGHARTLRRGLGRTHHRPPPTPPPAPTHSSLVARYRHWDTSSPRPRDGGWSTATAAVGGR